MSYILDALKKSEQERGRGTAPSVQTVHSSGLTYRSDKTHLWPYLLLAALFVNLAALLFFMMNRPEAGNLQPAAMPAETQPAVAAAETASPTTEPARMKSTGDPTEGTVYKPVFMPGAIRSDAVSASLQPAAEPITAAAVADATAWAMHGSVPEMDELPFEVLQQIPAMEFSAHVYSSNPIQRSIVINGRFMEEGDRFASDVFLAEITPDGAIFDFKGQLFHKRVVSAWN